MLADTLLRAPRTNGRRSLLRRGANGARELSLARMRIASGGREEYIAPDEETIVVLQEGQGVFAVNGRQWPVNRRSVFAERATALYLPPGQTLSVSATTPMEAVLV